MDWTDPQCWQAHKTRPARRWPVGGKIPPPFAMNWHRQQWGVESKLVETGRSLSIHAARHKIFSMGMGGALPQVCLWKKVVWLQPRHVEQLDF